MGRIRPVGINDGPEVVSLDGLGEGQSERGPEARKHTFWLSEMIWTSLTTTQSQKKASRGDQVSNGSR